MRLSGHDLTRLAGQWQGECFVVIVQVESHLSSLTTLDEAMSGGRVVDALQGPAITG
jgi:hypothetical protein